MWVTDIDGGGRELIATNARNPVWSRDGTRVAYRYVRGDKTRPFEEAAAYRRLGGTERFLTPWNSRFAFVPGDWTPDSNAVLGVFLLLEIGNSANVGVSVADLESQSGAAGTHSPLVTGTVPSSGTRRSLPMLVGFSLLCIGAVRTTLRNLWSSLSRGPGRLPNNGSVSPGTTNGPTSRGGDPTVRRSFSFQRDRHRILICGQLNSIPNGASRLASRSH